MVTELLTDYTVRTVALGAAVLGTVSGALGTFAVLRRESLYGDALSHATLPGVVVAFLLTGSRSPGVLMAGAAVAAVAAAGLVLTVVTRTRVKQDAALALVLSVFFGLGTVLLTAVAARGDAHQAGLDRFVFGQAATMLAEELRVTAILGGLALLTVALVYKELAVTAFDPAFARTAGLPVGRITVAHTALLVVAIVIGIQTVGVVLMAAFLITPAAAARQWTNRLGVTVWLAGVIGAASGVVGALISASGPDLPTGPVVVLVATAAFGVSLLFGARHGLVVTALTRRRPRP